ncbi:alanine racemase [uncultured Roseibium sp.]|uniref:alanine racemase n=1 Tax=uncultured Roseibium sp. TaxID=1936171 RepID=UPI0026222112|nr:alanine racemase [uncultured Roseibium sp.]
MIFPTLDTPCVLVDLDVAEANIRKYQAYCDSNALKLRPHIKTHKLPSLAKYQVAQGAVGITCQKVSEAEAMVAEGGIEDVLITYNILGGTKTARLRALSEKVRLSVVADNEVVAEGLSRTFADAEAPLTVLVECNTGADRCGVPSPAAAAGLAGLIDRLPGLRFGGLMTFPPVGRMDEAETWLNEAKALIESEGLEVQVVSSGGSPDMWRAHGNGPVTEHRIGTYVYNDRSLVAHGACGWHDCALTVLATVVSVPSPHHAIVDAGSKVLTTDLFGQVGHGHVLGRDDLAIDQLSEEHGRIVADGPINLNVGERLRIVPNHACVVANMLDRVEGVRGADLTGPMPVAARGQVW